MNGNSRQNMSMRVGEDILALAAGAGLGAGLMYLFDPNRGHSRRARLVGEAKGLLHRGESRAQKRGRDLLNRIEGIGVRLAEEVAPMEPPSDEILLERIRSRMGHIVSDPHEVEVRVEKGVVTLEGRLAHPERRRLTEEVRAMHGVKRLNAHLGRRLILSPALLVGLGAGLALFGKRNPPTAGTNAAQ